MVVDPVFGPRGGAQRFAGARVPLGRKHGRTGVPRCRAMGADLSFPSRFASKITLCEGIVAMVVRRTAGKGAESVREPVTGAGDGERTRTGEETSTRKTSAKARAAAKAANTAGGQPSTTGVTERRAAPEAADRDVATETVAEEAAGKKTGAKTVVAKKTTTGAPAADKAAAAPTARVTTTPAAPEELLVRPGESPWSPGEVEEARAELAQDAARLRTEILAAEEALNGLMRDSADAAGDDQADTGTKNMTREHEMALAENAREMLYQTERALERLESGTYGACEHCGRPIGKARMQAFPRATLCVECKQRQERR